MAEEYHHGGICGGNNWWSGGASGHAIVAASPCSLGFNVHFGCPNDIDMLKSRGSSSTTTCAGEIIHHIPNSNKASDLVLSDLDRFQNQNPHENNSDQIIGFGLNSSSTTSTVPSDLNQALLVRNYQNFMLPEDQMANQDFSLDQNGAPQNSYVNGFTSQLLYDPEEVVVPQPQPQSLFNNGSSSSMNYGTIISSNNENPSSTCWPRFSSDGLRPSQQQQQGGGGLQFSNINTPFWNSPAPSLNHDNIRSSGVFPSTMAPSQYVAPPVYDEHKPVTNSSNFTKANNNEDVQDSSSSNIKKKGRSFSSSSEPVFKRARIETPSPLPTFKVRKEKLGDRITALQQLVSPFGKTDTASVLHEAIEYIKFLHDQVGVLSTPYMNNGAQMQNQQGCEKLKESEKRGKQDLQSRGLCLVPVSSTFPVATETTADFWTPTFGATSFR